MARSFQNICMYWDRKEIDGDSINYVIAWYRKYKNTILEQMPIKTSGVTFYVGWIDRLESVIESWETSNFPLFLAKCYIYYPLSNIRKELIKSKFSLER